jgi:hypothetical protein
MSKAVVIRYETHPDQAAANQGLIEKVFAELNAERPAGLRYASFRLGDGVGFVHVAIVEEGSDALGSSAAFAAFQERIADRLVGPPDSKEATLVGSYGFGMPG